jgi:outer membrane protein OmpA-like peptidoglycan-associated protein
MIQRILLAVLIFTAKAGIAQDSSSVYFDFDKHELTLTAKQILDKIVSKPNLYSITIYGHTDQFGSNQYNDVLSEKRAVTVKDYITAKGVDPTKIKMVKGFGETMPVINKLDEISRQANRRVVIIASYEVFAKDSAVIEQTPKKEISETPKNPPTPVATTPVHKPVNENLIKEVTDTATREGDNIILKNINFYGGRHVFLPQSYPSLMELLYVMQTVPTLEIEIQGHICCIEGESDGQDIDTGDPFLSYNRARAVYEYLVEKGIDRKRMRYKGYGHKFPIIPYESNEAERTTNRRVEIKILKK